MFAYTRITPSVNKKSVDFQKVLGFRMEWNNSRTSPVQLRIASGYSLRPVRRGVAEAMFQTAAWEVLRLGGAPLARVGQGRWLDRADWGRIGIHIRQCECME